ncbi:hypothetical protein F5Y15DRAFT_76803 [Xylariaceae sp. FL0016]|nr:hypothetical protein F5Y15DRAFT_76803 [Xylariaceae sp. FL0016]
MRFEAYLSTALCAVAASTAALAEPINPLLYSDVLRYNPIFKRDVTCPADYFSCEDQGAIFDGTCCENGQICAVDAHSSAACCPTSATCTGVAPSTTVSASYVSNSYFSFPYIGKSFSNQAACTEAVSDCSRNYDACVSGLEGITAGYGVTVQVQGGGGTTVAAAQASLPSATATSVCQSLSTKACYNINTNICGTVGTTAGFTIGGANNKAPKPTTPPCMAGIIAGVGLGIMGAQL